jgi:hypothetical protein
MIANELYSKLNNDFIKDGITDLNWAARMPNLDQYLHNGCFLQVGNPHFCKINSPAPVGNFKG